MQGNNESSTPFPGIRGVAYCVAANEHFVVPANSPIKTYADANGKRIGVGLQEETPVNRYQSLSGFYGALALSRPDVVQASNVRMRISPIDMIDSRRFQPGPDKMSRTLKGLGMHLGASRVRITRLNQKWVYSPNGPPQYGKPVELN